MKRNFFISNFTMEKEYGKGLFVPVAPDKR